MKVFQKIITVTKDDLDDMNHVNNVRYVQWVQDIAKEHWQIATSREIQRKYIWVVLNHNITYKKPAFIDDKIRLCTYVQKSEGVTSVRIVEMFNTENDMLIAFAKTTWCLLGTKTKKPCRIHNDIIIAFH
ncbi:acyl-CoA thioesterase [Leptobacterium sp. I13]|uniref:acyl-CoA thioesterase n=1 Tax=Leptobacterium meishanense TaxID=3128904 RepID=UPI0030EBAD1E